MAIKTELQADGLALYNDNNERTLVRPSASAPNVILALPTTSGTIALEGGGSYSTRVFDGVTFASRSNTTTFTGIETVTFEAVADRYYDIRLVFYTQTEGAAQNHAFRWNGANLQLQAGYVTARPTTNTDSGTAPVLFMRAWTHSTAGEMTAANNRSYCVEYNALLKATTSGTVVLQFAQQSSGADAVTADSFYLHVQEVTV